MSREMTEEELNKVFIQVADAHIDLANKQLDGLDMHIVSSGLLYGASRFEAFTVASVAKNLQEYEASLEGAVEHYTELFRSMLQENLENYKSSFTQREAPRYEHLMKKQ